MMMSPVEVASRRRPGRQRRSMRGDAHRQPREPVADGGRPPARHLAQGGLHALYRRCALAVLNTGGDTDDARAIFDRYRRLRHRASCARPGASSSSCTTRRRARSSTASMIRGIQEHLFAVLRDIIYIHSEVDEHGSFELREPAGITNAVFHMLRNARRAASRGSAEHRGLLGRALDQPRGIRVHQARGLRAGPARPQRLHRLRPGRDEGPDEGRDDRPRQAAHPQRPLHRPDRARHHRRRAAQPDRQPARDHAGHREAPRGLRAARARHRGVPRRRGTAEEILYLLGILLDPRNEPQPFPVVFTGPRGSEEYLRADRRVPRSARWAERCARATASSSATRPRWRARCCAA